MQHSYRFSRFSILAAVIIFTHAGCNSPLAPVMPEWDAEMNVSIMTGTYTMEDMLSSDSVLTISKGADDILIVQRSWPLEHVTLADALHLDNSSYTGGQSIGLLKYDINDIVNTQITASQAFPMMQPGTLVVPVIAAAPRVDIPLDASAYFETMTFSSGSVLFTLENSFPIAITFPQAAVLLDDQGRTLATIPAGGTVAPGGTMELPAVSLNGLTLHKTLTLGVFLGTPGSDGQPVSIDGQQALRVRASLRGTQILSADAYLPPQEHAFEGRADISGNGKTLLTRGVAKSGTLKVDCTNGVDITADVTVTIHNVTINGLPITRTVTVAPKSTTSLEIPVAGAEFTPDAQRDLVYSVNVLTHDSHPNIVHVTSDDMVTVSGSLTDVVMESMEGTLVPQLLAIDVTRAFDLAFSTKLEGSITYADVRMWADINNHTPFPVDVLSGTVTGNCTRTGYTDSLHLLQQSVLPNAMQRIMFDNTEVTHFFNAFGKDMPDRMHFHSLLNLNPGGAYGIARSTDSIAGSLVVEVPFRVAVRDGSVSDTTAISFDAVTRDRLEHVEKGVFTLELENHLPAAVQIEPQFLDDAGNVLLVLNTASGNIVDVPSAVVDGKGFVSESTNSKVTVELAKSDFTRLAQSTHVRMRLHLNTSGTAPVAFRSTDYVKVRAMATLQVYSSAIAQ